MNTAYCPIEKSTLTSNNAIKSYITTQWIWQMSGYFYVWIIKPAHIKAANNRYLEAELTAFPKII